MTCEMSAREKEEEDLKMMTIDFGGPDEPFNTHFLLSCFEEKKLCPRFYGKNIDKMKVYDALTKDMHVEVKSQWGEMKCHCARIPILRLSKTVRNLNKVFLVCGAPASAETRCKYFQWIHTPLFIDNRPLHKLMYATNLSRAEWVKQAEANVEGWKQRNGKNSKQDVQTQTEQNQQDSSFAEAANQFAESAKKQEEQRKASRATFPWNSIPLPSTFQSSSEISKEMKKREQWKEVVSIAEHRFNSCVKGWHHLPPAEASVAEYLAKQKIKGQSLSPADEKFLNACLDSKHKEWKPPPGAEKYEKNKVAMAKAAYEDWCFGYLPEKVCSLASFCRKKKKEGLPLTPVEERFFAQLVNVCGPEETEKEKQESEKQFLKECDANNAQRRKLGLEPYSYETFRTFGTGIF